MIYVTSSFFAQNVGINQNTPTNSLHISPINVGDDPIRIDNMQAYASGDTTLLIIDNTTGIVRFVNKSDLSGMIGNLLLQDNNFVTNINNGGGSGGSPDQTLGTTATDLTLSNGGSVPLATINAGDWHLTGNTGTNSATDFIGTTDSRDFIFKTNNAEAMRILASGKVSVNSTTTFASSVFHSASTGAEDAITVNASGTGIGVYTQNSGTGAALVAIGTGANSAVVATAADMLEAGVIGVNTNATGGNGVIGAGNNVAPTRFTSGAGGSFAGNTGSYSVSKIATGTGVIGLGNNLITAYSPLTGAGGAFTGDDGSLSTGVSSIGTGVIGSGNNGSQYFMQTSGGGGAFTGTQSGAYGYATNTSGNSRGVIGEGSEYGVVSVGDFGGTGAKFFIIDHPLDPENKILKHACLESPEILNLYRGNVVLDANGEGTVTLPDYFTAINVNYSYTLTPIGSPSVPYILTEVDENGEFKIAGGNSNQKISWYVYAERNDKAINMNPRSKQMVEEKTGENQGKYISPEAYGKTREYSYFGGQAFTPKKTEGKTVKLDVKVKQ